MSKFKILLIEDDVDLNELLVFKLTNAGYELISLFDFEGVYDRLDNEQIDLLIVDRNLPSGDALERIQDLRKQGYQEAVIFLTARSLHQDLLEGFEKGCDDYICKPFDFKELLLRIGAILKRHKNKERLVFDDFVLDLINHDFFLNNEKLKISNLDYELLKCFFENPNTLLTRQFLSENVWKDDSTSDKTINIALTRLRNKFPKLKDRIISVRGIGYKLC